MKRIRILGLAIGIATLLAATGHADDTDIYLESSAVTRNDAPNVLFVIDTSATMDHNTILTPPAYDAAVTYTGGGYDGKKIYWCTNSSTNACTSGVPPSSTTQVFDPTANDCAASQFNLGSTTGAEGFYSARVAGWNAKTASQGKWSSLHDLTVAPTSTNVIECLADELVDPPSVYANGGNNIQKSSQYTSNSNQALDWTGAISSATLYSGNYLNYVANPPATVTKTRFEVAREAVTAVIDSTPDVRFGVMVMNQNWDGVDESLPGEPPHGGRMIFAIDNMDASRRASMTAAIDSLSGHPSDATPFSPHGGPLALPIPSPDKTAYHAGISEALYEAMLYLGGQAVDYGNDNTSFNVPPYAPARDTAAEDIGSYVSPFLIECQQAYVILVTDGDHALTDFDGDANSKIAALTANPADTGEDIDTSFGDSPLDELAEYMYNNDLYSTLDGTQRAVTYTVGIDITGGSVQEELLQDTADKGHGIYTNGTQTSRIVTAIQNVIVSIHAATSSFSAPTLSVNAFNKLFNRDEVYFALFSPTTTTRWNGNVKKYQLCDADQDTAGTCEFGEIIDVNNNPIIDPVTLRIKDEAVSYWDTIEDGGEVTSGGAGGQIPDAGARNYYSVVGDYSTMTFPVTLSSFPVTPNSGDNFHDTMVADPALLGLFPAATSTEVVEQIEWLLGVDVFDENDDGDITDQRWAFADPLHARPVAVTFGFEPDGFGDSDPDKPIIKLFAATNDGVIRMINDDNGQEEWAFMPQELLGNQYALARNAEGDHIYGMDGTPQFWANDLDDDGIIEPADGEFMYMFIGMRRGGRNIYGFDVTPTDAQTQPGDRARTDQFSPKLLWVIQGGVDVGFEDLGFTWSNPQVTEIRVKCNSCSLAGDSESSTVVMFGGGYDTNQDSTINDPDGNGPDTRGNGVYIVEPTDGSKIVSIGGTAATGVYDLVVPDMEFSIPTDLALLDSNADGETDRIYFGDAGGQVWRIDLGDQLDKVSGNQTGGTSVGRLADVSCTTGTRVACNSTAVQDRRKFLHAPDIAQVRDNAFSVNPDYDVVVILSGDRADPLDRQTEGVVGSEVEAVNQRLYVFRDYLVADVVTSTNYPKCVSGGALSTCSAPLSESDLFDLTDNVLQDETSASFATAKAALIDATGWYIDLKEDTAITTPAGSSVWIGEKGLARPVIFDDTIFATTFIPANDETALQTCTAREGLGRLYGLNLLTAAAMVDFNQSGGDPTDADRSLDLGGGIPSELVVVIREGGVTGLVGVSGGTATPPLDSELPRFTTFWYTD